MQILLFHTQQWLLLQAATPVATQAPSSSFNWAVAATILGIAALVIGAIVKIFYDEKKVNDDVLSHTNQLTVTVNLLNDKLNEHNSKIASLETDLKNVYRDLEELKQLIRDIEKDNFNALGKVVDKVDSIKDLLINLKSKK